MPRGIPDKRLTGLTGDARLAMMKTINKERQKAWYENNAKHVVQQRKNRRQVHRQAYIEKQNGLLVEVATPEVTTEFTQEINGEMQDAIHDNGGHALAVSEIANIVLKVSEPIKKGSKIGLRSSARKQANAVATEIQKETIKTGKTKISKKALLEVYDNIVDTVPTTQDEYMSHPVEDEILPTTRAMSTRNKKPVAPPITLKGPPLTENKVLTILEEWDFKKDANKNTRINDVKQIFRLTGCDDLRSCLLNYDFIHDSIETGFKKLKENELYKTTSKLSMVKTILYLLDHVFKKSDNPKNPNKFAKLMPALNPDTRRLYNHWKNTLDASYKREQEQEKKKKVLPMSKIVDIMAKAYNNEENKNMSKQFIIASLYNEFPVRDDFNLKLVSSVKLADKGTKNYLVVPAKGRLQLILNTFKTSGNAEYHIEGRFASEALSKLLRAYIEEQKLKINLKGDSRTGYLFHEEKLSQWISTSMWKKVIIPDRVGGVDYFRHAKITEVLVDMTDAQRADLAVNMGHSPNTQMNYMRDLLKKKGQDNLAQFIDADLIKYIPDNERELKKFQEQKIPQGVVVK